MSVVSDPTVTILMPVYNGGDYLKQAIESLYKQDYENLKFIIADDCSTDGSFEYLQEFTKGDPRVKLYKNKTNLGANKNYDILFEQVETELFMYGDQDDIWEEGFISECISLFKKYPQISSATTYARSMPLDLSCEYFIDDGVTTLGQSAPERYKTYRLKNHSGNDVGGIFCSVHKTNVFAEGMPFKRVLGNDHVLLAQMAILAEFATSDKILFIKRRGGNSDSLDNLARAYGIKKDLYFKLFPYLPREIEFQKIIFNAKNLSILEKFNLILWSTKYYLITHHIRGPLNFLILKTKHLIFGDEKIIPYLKSENSFLKKVSFLFKMAFKNFKRKLQ